MVENGKRGTSMYQKDGKDKFIWQNQKAWPLWLQTGLTISVVVQDIEGRVEGNPRESNEGEDDPVSEGWKERWVEEECKHINENVYETHTAGHFRSLKIIQS